jgi:hypothetical protein
VLTLDSLDQPGEPNRLAVVVDPPIIFPISQLCRLSALCGVQVTAVASSISHMLGLAISYLL